MPQRLSSPTSALKPAYDVVVVGSGYGGGVSASRLARAGQRVCVIERGREVPTGEFPARLPELRRELQLNGGKMRSGSRTGLYDFRMGTDIHVLVGCGLGGGSLINAGVGLRPDARVFADGAWPDEVTKDGLLDLGFERAQMMLRPSRYRDARELTKYRALEAASTAFGTPPVAAPVVVSFEETVNPAGVAQPACTLCGDCCSGCNVGAKNTVAVTYLPDAKAHGAEIFTELTVKRLEKRDGGWRVHFAPSEEKDAEPSHVDAKTVVLAAGTLGSTEILLRSRDHGLKLSDRLGDGFSANGDIIAFALGGREKVNGVGVGEPPKYVGDAIGACVAGEIELPDATDLDRSMIIQEGVMPSCVGAPAPGVLHRRRSAARRRAKSHQGRLSRPAVASPHLLRRVARRRQGPHPARQRQRSGALAACRRPAGLCAGRRSADQSGGGGRCALHQEPSAATSMGVKPATAHPLGGCGMGDDAGRGVVNHKCQVFAGTSGDDVHSGSMSATAP
ncbi:MAG: GMC family oxidoreductase N-terminal domain-containing protein [Hyphomicrobiales bacterium]